MDVFTARKVEELRNELLHNSRRRNQQHKPELGEPCGDLTGKLRLDRREQAPGKGPEEGFVDLEIILTSNLRAQKSLAP